MRQTPQTQVIRRLVVLILVIGALFFLKIVGFLVPAVTPIAHQSMRQDKHNAELLSQRNDEKVVMHGFSENADTSPLSAARSVAKPLPLDPLPSGAVTPAPYPALYDEVPVEELDPTLEEGTISVEEHYAQEQYLQEVAEMEEMLQQEFDPTAAMVYLTAEQVAAIEEEIQEKILEKESLPLMLEDVQLDEYGGESTPAGLK